MRDKIVCMASVAHNGASRSATSNLAARGFNFFTGTTTSSHAGHWNIAVLTERERHDRDTLRQYKITEVY